MSTYNLLYDYIQYCVRPGIPQLINLDGTYKLVKNNYILLVIGCQDYGGIFHALGACLTSNENNRSYSFLLNAVKSIYADINYAIKPEYVMSDGAGCIGESIEFVFPELEDSLTKLTCRYHAKFNIQKKICNAYFPDLQRQEKEKLYKDANADVKLL